MLNIGETSLINYIMHNWIITLSEITFNLLAPSGVLGQGALNFY